MVKASTKTMMVYTGLCGTHLAVSHQCHVIIMDYVNVSANLQRKRTKNVTVVHVLSLELVNGTSYLSLSSYLFFESSFKIGLED